MKNRNLGVLGITAPALHEERERLHRNWGWLLGLGIVLSLLGVIALGAAGFTTLVSVSFLGALLVVYGAVQVVHAFSFRFGQGFLLALLMSILSVVVGGLMMANPGAGAVSLTLLVASLLLAGGIFRALWSVLLRYPQWGWSLFSGIVSTLLGFYIAGHLLYSSVFLIGTVVGIEMLFSGWSWIMLAFAARAYEPALISGETPSTYPRKAG